MTSSENLQFIRTTLPPELFTHEAYLRSLGTITDCLVKLTAKPGAVVGCSPARIKNMLCAMLVHASGDCMACARGRSNGLLPAEQSFMNARRAYAGSKHDRASSLNAIAFVFPAPQTRAQADRQLLLIPEFIAVLDARIPGAKTHEPMIVQTAAAG